MYEFACECGRRSHKIDHVFGRHAGVPNFVEQSVANACLNALHEGTVLACFKAILVQTHQVSTSNQVSNLETSLCISNRFSNPESIVVYIRSTAEAHSSGFFISFVP